MSAVFHGEASHCVCVPDRLSGICPPHRGLDELSRRDRACSFRVRLQRSRSSSWFHLRANGGGSWISEWLLSVVHVGQGEGNSSIVCQEGATANTTTTTTTSSAPDFILHTAGLSSCPTGTVPVLTVSRCEGAAAAPGFPFWPTEGCYLYAQGGNFYFNYNAGRGNGLAKRACEVGGGPSTTSTTTTNIGQGYILQAGGFTDCPADTGPILSVLGCSSWFGRDAETDPSHPKGWVKGVKGGEGHPC